MNIKRSNTGLRWKQIFSLQGISIICEYELLSFFRTKSRLLNELLWLPILYPLLFVSGIASFISKNITTLGTSSYLSFVCPGLMGLRIFGQFSNVVYRLTIDKRYGLQGLKIGSGVGVLGYVFGHFILPSIVISWQILITLAVFTLFSIPLPNIQQVLLTLCIAVISTFFWSALAILVSFSFKSYYKRDLFINTVSLPITLSCPVFFSLEHAPTYLQWINKCNPLSYNILALRKSFLYGEVNNAFWVVLALTTLLILWDIAIISKGEFVNANT